MKAHRLILLIIIFISDFTFGQSKNKNTDIASIEDEINIKLSKAFSHVHKVEYDKALILTLECLKKSDSIKNDYLLGKSYTTAGIINSEIGKKEQAILNYRKAEAIFIKTKNYKNLGSVYNNIGVAYDNYLEKIDTTKTNNQRELHSIKQDYKRNLDSIKKYYKKALDTYTLANNSIRRAYAFSNLGEVNLKLGDLANAEKMLKKALSIAKTDVKSSFENSLISQIYFLRSKILMRKRNFKKAEEYINMAEKIALEHQHNDILTSIYKNKGEILEAQGNFNDSYKYLNKHNQHLIKLHKNERSTITLEALAKFEAKEQKSLLEQEILKNNIKKNKLEKSNQIIILSIILLVISIFVIFLLKNNNLLRLENNKLLVIKNKKLKDLQLNTELTFLKTQIQPHFFFNTLNNLYSLIIEGSDKAKDVVIKLSELMKYTLSETKTITVPLLDEINNIKNYLELESLRYGKKASPTIQMEGEMKDIRVPPLLFITFIENSFKHNDVRDETFKLSISFKTVNSKHLYFQVQNTHIVPTENQKEKIKGIGIENIKRRLMLIYKDKYELNIIKNKKKHQVDLKIPI